MTMPTQILLVPVPVPVAGQVWNKRASAPKYPPQHSTPWPLHQGIPPSRDPVVQRELIDARRLIAEHKARKLLQELSP